MEQKNKKEIARCGEVGGVKGTRERRRLRRHVRRALVVVTGAGVEICSFRLRAFVFSRAPRKSILPMPFALAFSLSLLFQISIKLPMFLDINCSTDRSKKFATAIT